MPKKEQFKNPKLIKFIYELKTEGMSDSKIAKKVEENFGIKIFRTTIGKIYKDYMAHNDMVADSLGSTAKSVIDWNKKSEEKFERIERATTKLLDAIEEVSINMPPETYIKLTPTILAVCREILSQLQYLKKEQDKMALEQKDAIMSPLQIMKVIDKELKKKEKNG